MLGPGYLRISLREKLRELLVRGKPGREILPEHGLIEPILEGADPLQIWQMDILRRKCSTMTRSQILGRLSIPKMEKSVLA